ncbi:MAG: hypothetical protein AB8B85_11685 [Paracoccaceae bacterium]
MFDAEAEPGQGGEGRIVLAQVKSAYWLLEGEAYLSALLDKGAPYPTPVQCIDFGTEFDLMRMLPEGQGTGDLWAIHPDIVERLRRQDEIVTVTLPDDA